MDEIIERVGSLLDDRNVRIILAPGDRDYMRTVLASARSALRKQQYGRAWLGLRDAQFWWLWKEYLEKAAQAAAFLPASIKVVKQENVQALPVIGVARTTGAISVDGKLDEADWQRGAFSGGFVTREKMPTFAETGVKAMRDDGNLYLAFVCADQDVENVKAEATSEKDIFHIMDDVVIMFVQPDQNKPTYYQMAFNTKGVQFDQRVIGADRDYEYHPNWKTAVRKNEGYWAAEVQLPFKAFDVGDPTATQWRMNFHRIFRGNLVDPSSWSFSGRDWHKPERFGKADMR